MSDGFLGPKPVRSVAAFLWMPQFKLSFQHMSHIMPVFVRTLAGIFAGAGLIERNHPALRYGAPDEGSSFSGLMGDAWATLQTKNATAAQWGLFISVGLMLALLVMSFATTLATVFFGIGTTAQAQMFSQPQHLFSHPLGDSSVDNHQPTPPYDMAVPPVGTPQGDYGIMMLDKVIRAGAYGKGIPMQNALRDLMLVYNSAVLVIASVILFWLIISIVVETARTGQVGGGRHNMVWAPIRIVFALALLIPLGSAGFSSGQYMLMKVAEWGSNLGTNAWTAYVEGTMRASNIVADQATSPATSLIKDYEKIWLCTVTFNSMMDIMGSAERMTKTQAVTNPLNGKVEYRFVNSLGTHSCGTITYETGALGTALDFLGGATLGGQVITSVTDGQGDAISDKLSRMKQTMRNEYVRIFFSMESSIQKEACGFASTSVLFAANQPENRAVLTGQPECAGASLSSTAPRSYTGIESINTAFGREVESALQAQIGSLRQTFSSNTMLEMMTARGWAGMGAWYHRIAQINAVTASLTKPPITATSGNFEARDNQEAAAAVNRMLGDFDNWWTTYSVSGSGSQAINNTSGALDSTSMDVSSSTKKASLVNTLKGLSDAGSDVTDVLWDAIGFGPSLGAGVMVAMGGGEDVYPLAQLSAIGDKLTIAGVAIHGLLLAAHAIMTLLSTGVGGSILGFGVEVQLDFSPLAQSYIFEVAGTLGTVLMMAGFMLKFYVPLIPFMRVIFAVLTWIISVFEAVIMIPIVALAHLNLDGEGLSGGAKQVWPLWLNILLRPILTVIGFVGALLVFDAFVSFFNDNFAKSLQVGLPSGGFTWFLSFIFMMVVYVFIIYTVANTVFKMLDVIPSAMMRWMGGSPDHSFDNDGDKQAMLAATNMMRGISPKPRPVGPGGGNAAGVQNAEGGGGGGDGGGDGGGGGGGGKTRGSVSFKTPWSKK